MPRLKGTNGYADIAGADVVIVTAGVPRKPGMSRDDLLGINLKVMAAVGDGIKANCPNAFVICITNPLDAMVWALQKFSGIPHAKIVGMAGVLDQRAIPPFPRRRNQCLGGRCQRLCAGRPWRHHGADAALFHGRGHSPCPNWSRWAGSSRTGWTPSSIAPATAAPKSSACSRPGRPITRRPPSAIAMAESYLKDQKRVLPCAVHVNGAYGITDLYVGLPVVIGEKGVERVVELDLTDAEKTGLENSSGAVKGLIEACKKLEPKLA